MSQFSPSQVLGTWSLESFEIEDLQKQISPWGQDANGLLIYSDTGHVSVAINKVIARTSENESEDIFDSILFYAGTFRIEGTTIRHQVTNASNPSRIGKEMIRYATLDGEVMTLVTPQEAFGRAILRWKRVNR